MKTTPEISIIIPAFNAEAFVENSIRSIVNSTAKSCNYEIIAVDDASTDNTLNILKKLAEEIPNLNVYFRHKAGPGGARNLGINYSKGKYLMFVDADDHINQKNLAHLINTLIWLYNTDIIGFDYKKCDKDGNLSDYRKNRLFPYCREMSGAEYMNQQSPESTLWGYLFKRRFLLDNTIKFIEKNIYEHEDFISRTFCLAETVVFLPVEIYYFHHDIENSLSNNKDPKKREQFIANWFAILEELQQFGFMLSDAQAEKGLEIKLNNSAASMIKHLITSNFDTDFITYSISQLKEINLYPLNKSFAKGLNERIFTKITAREDGILWLRNNVSSNNHYGKFAKWLIKS